MEDFVLALDEKITLYYENVRHDFAEMILYYPFSSLYIPPTARPSKASVRVVAVHKDLIEDTGAVEADFLGEYSKELYVIIPFDYKTKGCKVYGAKWLDRNRLKDRDIHFYMGEYQKDYGYEFCLGVPDSFRNMRNVLLENIKTADMMLIAYKDVMSGKTKKLELKAYAHGALGEKEYLHDRKRYI